MVDAGLDDPPQPETKPVNRNAEPIKRAVVVVRLIGRTPNVDIGAGQTRGLVSGLQLHQLAVKRTRRLMSLDVSFLRENKIPLRPPQSRVHARVDNPCGLLDQFLQFIFKL